MTQPGPENDPRYGGPNGSPAPYGPPPPYGAPQPYGTPPPYGTPQQFGPPQAYGPPQPYYGGYPVVPAQPTSGAAVTSLVCGILGFFTCAVTSVIAVIAGHVALRDTRSGRVGGQGMAVAGLVMGYLVLIPAIILVALWIMVMAGLLASMPFLTSTSP